jgi:hypothetical protein
MNRGRGSAVARSTVVMTIRRTSTAPGPSCGGEAIVSGCGASAASFMFTTTHGPTGPRFVAPDLPPPPN